MCGREDGEDLRTFSTLLMAFQSLLQPQCDATQQYETSRINYEYDVGAKIGFRRPVNSTSPRLSTPESPATSQDVNGQRYVCS